MPGFEAWREVRKLGEGGWGEVYAGLDPECGELRAVKITKGRFDEADPWNGALFRRELELAQALDHPHVVRAYRVGEQTGRPFLVMEYCGQGSLADRVERDGPCRPRRRSPCSWAYWTACRTPTMPRSPHATYVVTRSRRTALCTAT